MKKRVKKADSKTKRVCNICCNWHSSPINIILHIIAFILIISGLWNHSIKTIIIAVLLAVIGHLIERLRK